MPANKTAKRLVKLRRFTPLYLLMLPGLLYFFINNYLPMIGLIIAFKEIDFRLGIFGSPWIGFKNFEYLFASSDAWLITFNTLSYNAVFIIINIALSILVAILLADMAGRKLKRFYQSAVLLPYLISMIIISYLGNAFMNNEIGFINNMLVNVFGAEKIKFYSTASYWPFILVFINAWKNIGYLCIVFLSSIIGIDDAYYEAASLEGASKIQRVRYITIPLITPIIIMMVMIFIGRIFYFGFPACSTMSR